MPQLNADSCALFELPFFQFRQWHLHAPEELEAVKAAYKNAWQNWCAVIRHTATLLQTSGNQFATPHIERWSNGWQLRAHFFAFFKYQTYQDSAAILSIILNRRRLSVSLDWHAYRANRSIYPLESYQQWAALLNTDHHLRQQYAAYELWQDTDNEYADYLTLAQQANPLPLLTAPHYYIIGQQLNAANLSHHDSSAWIAAQILGLLPLYEAAHQPLTSKS